MIENTLDYHWVGQRKLSKYDVDSKVLLAGSTAGSTQSLPSSTLGFCQFPASWINLKQVKKITDNNLTGDHFDFLTEVQRAVLENSKCCLDTEWSFFLRVSSIALPKVFLALLFLFFCVFVFLADMTRFVLHTFLDPDLVTFVFFGSGFFADRFGAVVNPKALAFGAGFKPSSSLVMARNPAPV